DAVAGPVVKILVGDDRLDALVVEVGRGLRRRQHIFVVEDVEALVLHRAHVEVGDRDDHEDVEIVFAAERALVPSHGALERIHGVEAARLLARLDIDGSVTSRPDMVRKRPPTQASWRPPGANRDDGSGKGAGPPGKGRPAPAPSPAATRLPLASSTGASAFSASMRVV